MTKAQKAQQLYDQARKHLRQLAGVSGGRKQWHYSPPNAYVNGDQAPAQARPGMFNVQYGVEPSPAEIQAYIRHVGGDRSAKKAQGSSVGKSNSTPSAGGTAPAPGEGESIRELIAKMAADVKAQQDAANAANEARYGEVKGSNEALYGRVMGEVDNWGGVQSQLNEERARQSMGNIRGNLASRGLTDSTIGDAFQARNDRDLALTQQDLSERKSARSLGYDIDLTNNANAFIERRTDRAPDNSALLALSAKLGEAEALERGRTGVSQQSQQRGTTGRNRRQPSYLGPQGVSPAYAGMLANQIQGNFAGQLGNAMGMIPRYGGGGPGIVSNRYPTRRSPEEYAAVERNQQLGESVNNMPPIIPQIPTLGGGIGAAVGGVLGMPQMKRSNPPGTAAKAMAAGMKAKNAAKNYRPSPLLYAAQAAAPYMGSYPASKAVRSIGNYATGLFHFDPFSPENYDRNDVLRAINGKMNGFADYLQYGPDTFGQ